MDIINVLPEHLDLHDTLTDRPSTVISPARQEDRVTSTVTLRLERYLRIGYRAHHARLPLGFPFPSAVPTIVCRYVCRA